MSRPSLNRCRCRTENGIFKKKNRGNIKNQGPDSRNSGNNNSSSNNNNINNKKGRDGGASCLFFLNWAVVYARQNTLMGFDDWGVRTADPYQKRRLLFTGARFKTLDLWSKRFEFRNRPEPLSLSLSLSLSLYLSFFFSLYHSLSSSFLE